MSSQHRFPVVIQPEKFSDKNIVGSVVSFINDYIPSSTSHQASGDEEKVIWVKFEDCDLNDPNITNEEDRNLPLVILLGTNHGLQIWSITSSGESFLLYCQRGTYVHCAKVLPSPEIYGNTVDIYASRRPVIGLCETSSGSGSAVNFGALRFLSLRNNEDLHHFTFNSEITRMEANKRFVVVARKDCLTVITLTDFQEKFSISNCRTPIGGLPTPIALGTRWLAFADSKRNHNHLSEGGDTSSDSSQPMATTVINVRNRLWSGISSLTDFVSSSVSGPTSSHSYQRATGAPSSGPGLGSGGQRSRNLSMSSAGGGANSSGRSSLASSPVVNPGSDWLGGLTNEERAASGLPLSGDFADAGSVSENSGGMVTIIDLTELNTAYALLLKERSEEEERSREERERGRMSGIISHVPLVESEEMEGDEEGDMGSYPGQSVGPAGATTNKVNVHWLQEHAKANNAGVLVAHFQAHRWAPVSCLELDPAGMLLVTACSQGHDIHVFRISTQPLDVRQTAVHHLYRLHRGDTPCRIVNMTVSRDSRWVGVTSDHGTTHLFPITPYGGAITVRTHTSLRVVNRSSRYHKSAGIDEMDLLRPDLTRSAIRSSTGGPSVGGADSGFGQDDRYNCFSPNQAYNTTNPRLPPYPQTCTVQPELKIKQSLGFTPWTTGLPSPTGSGSPATQHHYSSSTPASYSQHGGPSTMSNMSGPMSGGSYRTTSMSGGTGHSTANTGGSGGRVRASSLASVGSGSSTGTSRRETSNQRLALAARFATSRCFLPGGSVYAARERDTIRRPIDNIFILTPEFKLIEYDLNVIQQDKTDRVHQEAQITLEHAPMGQWRLNLSLRHEYLPPFPAPHPLMKRTSHSPSSAVSSGENSMSSMPPGNPSSIESVQSGTSDQDPEAWISQVEIFTHTVPYRRLWMGPQFTFKPYQEDSGVSSTGDSPPVSPYPVGVSPGAPPMPSQPLNVPSKSGGRGGQREQHQTVPKCTSGRSRVWNISSGSNSSCEWAAEGRTYIEPAYESSLSTSLSAEDVNSEHLARTLADAMLDDSDIPSGKSPTSPQFTSHSLPTTYAPPPPNPLPTSSSFNIHPDGDNQGRQKQSSTSSKPSGGNGNGNKKSKGKTKNKNKGNGNGNKSSDENLSSSSSNNQRRSNSGSSLATMDKPITANSNPSSAWPSGLEDFPSEDEMSVFHKPEDTSPVVCRRRNKARDIDSSGRGTSKSIIDDIDDFESSGDMNEPSLVDLESPSQEGSPSKTSKDGPHVL